MPPQPWNPQQTVHPDQKNKKKKKKKKKKESTIGLQIMSEIKAAPPTPPQIITKLLKTNKRESYKQPEGKKDILFKR